MATGSPKVVSSAQLMKMLFESGAVDAKTCTVSEVLNAMMVHGFYTQTHPQKRDSYGASEVPLLGLVECQRWATLFLAERLKATEQRRSQFPRPAQSNARRPFQECRAKWCRCGGSGCVLAQSSWEWAPAE